MVPQGHPPVVAPPAAGAAECSPAGATLPGRQRAAAVPTRGGCERRGGGETAGGQRGWSGEQTARPAELVTRGDGLVEQSLIFD